MSQSDRFLIEQMPHRVRQKQKIMIVFHQLSFALSEFYYPNRKKFGLEIWCQLTRAKPMPNPGFHRTPWVSPTSSKLVIYPCQPVKKSWVWEQSDRPKNFPNSEKPKLNQVLHQQGWQHNWKNMGKSKPWASAENLGYSTGYSVRYYIILHDMILYCIVLY